MHSAAHSSSQVLGGGPPGLITPQCETLWCSWRMGLSERPGVAAWCCHCWTPRGAHCTADEARSVNPLSVPLTHASLGQGETGHGAEQALAGFAWEPLPSC